MLSRNSVIFLQIFSLIVGSQVEGQLDVGLNPVSNTLDVWHQRNARLSIRNNNRPDCVRPDIYECVEPPDAVPLYIQKTCNYRNYRYHEQVYRWVAGRGCLLYTPDFLFVGGVNSINLNTGCLYGDFFAPCLEIVQDDGSCACYPFDPGLVEVVAAVEEALVPSAQDRWVRCFYTAADCCSHVMLENSTTADIDSCEATFDGWTCWNPAEPDTTAYEVCSEFAYSNTGPTCHHYSSKQCTVNGTWELQTDYSSCSVAPRLIRRYRYHIVMLSISIATCIPAIFVFFFYKRLRVTRVILHRNLLMAIVIRNVLVIISRSEIYLDELTSASETAMSRHSGWCRALAVGERLAGNLVFMCMLVEGIYLHRLIVAVFRQKLNVKWLYGVGVLLAVIPVAVWGALMGVYQDHSCWLVYTLPAVQWALDGPRLAVLLLNTILFVDVLRVLLTKIRNSENANQLSTTKATLFLMPLFGTQFLLTAFRPNTTDCTGEQVYYYITYSLEGLQGFIVAILYCYLNKEVHTLVKATYKKTENAVVSRVRRDSAHPRSTLGPSSDRRLTYSTGLSTQTEPKDQRARYATVKPKLHVAEIISIQASEKLVDILEPVYESIHVVNEGYTNTERSDVESEFSVPNQTNKPFRPDEYYGFTYASSVSIDCQDWIRTGVSSPTSSIYNNSVAGYEGKYMDRKVPVYARSRDSRDIRSNIIDDPANTIYEDTGIREETSASEDQNNDVAEKNNDLASKDEDYNDSMLSDIMQHIEYNDSDENQVSNLDPNLLSPNRKDGDKIIFVD